MHQAILHYSPANMNFEGSCTCGWRVITISQVDGVANVERHMQQFGVTNIVRVTSSVGGDVTFMDGGGTHTTSATTAGWALPTQMSPELTAAMQRIASLLQQQALAPPITSQLDALTEAIRELSERIDDLAHKE